jgi:hypothetical protein
MGSNIARENAHPINTIVSVLTIGISTFGILVGSSLLYILAKKRWSKLCVDLRLVAITLFADITVNLWSTICAITDLSNTSYYLSDKVGCNINGTITILVFIWSVNSVAVTAVERFILITLEKKVYEPLYYIILSILTFINILSCVVTIILDGFTIHPTTIYCMFKLDSTSGKIGLGIVGVSEAASILAIYITYLGIIIKRRSLAIKAKRNFSLQHNDIRINSSSTIRKSVLIILCISISNLPYCTMTLLALTHPKLYTPLLDGIITMCMIINSVFNSFIILEMRPDLCEKLVELINSIIK